MSELIQGILIGAGGTLFVLGAVIVWALCDLAGRDEERRDHGILAPRRSS